MPSAPSSPDMASLHAQFVADSCGYVKSMLLRCAVDLGIPRAVHRLNRPASVADICSELGIPSSKSSALRRVMRLLAVMGYFSVSGEADADARYSLTPIAKHYFVDIDIAPHLHLRTHHAGVNAFRSLPDWLRSSGEASAGSAFELANGMSLWALAGSDPSFNKVFNESMGAQPASFAFAASPEAAPVFRAVRSLVDVGGNTGVTARAVTAAYPEIAYTVLDLPHVIAAVPESVRKELGGVSFVPGSMFDGVPSADAVLLKLILHDWDDESCVKILKKCKEAIPTKEEGGKVIIIDIVRESGARAGGGGDAAADAYMDVLMMVSLGGAEREESEWKALFDKAGFTGGYKITSISAAVQSVIEVFP